jgi:acetylornithine deacetylase/succinyl-diaminopimelate desuccinylase-like protein
MLIKSNKNKHAGNEMPVKKALNYADKNRQSFLEELKSFLRIPSIGTNPENESDTIAAAQWLAGSMKSAGLDNVRLITTSGMPLVYGDWLQAGTDQPTILIYGHYDVQPADPIEEWSTPPFEPTVIDQYLYCRGASDDKGQLFIHIKSIESYLKGWGHLPVNIKCLFEGEEEAGGEAIDEFVQENQAFLSADTILISDTSLIDQDQPSIVSGIRGNCYAYLDVYGPKRDLHSGSLGGVVDNPINVMSHIISKLKDEDGKRSNSRQSNK